MRVAVLADIHGNLPACEAVLDDIAKAAPDYVVAAGDLALRGAHPRETLDLLDDRCDVLLMGNTDCYIAGQYLGGAYRERDHWKTDLLLWTRDQVGPTWVERLGTLPFSVRYTPRRGQDLFVCHANPRNLEDSLEPTLDEATLRRFFANVDAAAVAFGHLHFPYRRRIGRMVIADVASAGLPRDGDLRPAWGLFTYTPKGWRVQIRRVRYQVRKATQAITARRLPGAPLLVHKLVEARYRNHAALTEAARRHSGLPPLRPAGPGGLPRVGPAAVDRGGVLLPGAPALPGTAPLVLDTPAVDELLDSAPPELCEAHPAEALLAEVVASGALTAHAEGEGQGEDALPADEGETGAHPDHDHDAHPGDATHGEPGDDPVADDGPLGTGTR